MTRVHFRITVPRALGVSHVGGPLQAGRVVLAEGAHPARPDRAQMLLDPGVDTGADALLAELRIHDHCRIGAPCLCRREVETALAEADDLPVDLGTDPQAPGLRRSDPEPVLLVGHARDEPRLDAYRMRASCGTSSMVVSRIS